MKIYTHTGDDGTTSLSGGKRVLKTSPKVEAYGSVDELIAWVGLLRSYPENSSRKEFLVYIQDQLMKCAATLSGDPENKMRKILLPDSDCIIKVESEIDRMTQTLPALNSFILPGGNIAVANCNIARCVCRRAERNVLRLKDFEEIPPIIPELLNRLSDYFFVLSRKLSLELDNEEIKWPR
jgi:cob(I)alamin adenosyltransferase